MTRFFLSYVGPGNFTFERNYMRVSQNAAGYEKNINVRSGAACSPSDDILQITSILNNTFELDVVPQTQKTNYVVVFNTALRPTVTYCNGNSFYNYYNSKESTSNLW